MPRSKVLTGILIAAIIGTIAFVVIQQMLGQVYGKKLEQSIANAIIKDQVDFARQGYRSPENAVIVRIQPEDASAFDSSSWDYTAPMSIWKYEKGTLKSASQMDWEQAKKDGNSFLFIFTIRKIEITKAEVDVLTFYPRVYDETLKDFRSGGNGSHRTFEYSGETWFQKNMRTFEYWD